MFRNEYFVENSNGTAILSDNRRMIDRLIDWSIDMS
jgi:hypothetical protein